MEKNHKIPSILNYFDALDDPRIDRQKLHKLTDIIFITVAASITGCFSWNEIEDFAHDNREWLEGLLELANGIPSHDTIRRTISRLSPEGFLSCFSQFVDSLRKKVNHEIVSIDGKSLRSSGDENKKPIHLVNAWSRENQLVLGQVCVDQKSNEITAIPILLGYLELKDCIVTLDAMGTQKDIAEKIIDKKAHYVLALKANHESLYEEVQSFFRECNSDIDERKTPPWIDTYKTTEKGHGRDEQRDYFISSTVGDIHELNDWKGVRSIGMVISHRATKGKYSVEKRYFLTSLDDNARNFAKAVRSHWAVENQLHWSLDVLFNEDLDRKRYEDSAQNYSMIRKLTLNLLKAEPSNISINRKRMKAARNTSFLEKILKI